MTDSFDEMIDCFVKPKQILFLSADLVGSTALKQIKRDFAGKHIPDSEKWAKVIQELFLKISSKFAKISSENNIGTKNSNKPILWKTVGDEIIYRKYISNHSEIYDTVLDWITAAKETRSELKSQFSSDLDIKCTAWLGEFPILNRVILGAGHQTVVDFTNGISSTLSSIVNFETSPVKAGFEIDFIGPSVDIGFRLSRLSSSRKFIISVDTAYLLMKCLITNRKRKSKLPKIFYEGTVHLSGVFGGLTYPVFWIDMSSEADHESLEKLEDKLVKREPCDLEKAIEFCETFYAERSIFIDQPFIIGDNDLHPNDIPSWYDSAIESTKEIYKNSDSPE